MSSCDKTKESFGEARIVFYYRKCDSLTVYNYYRHDLNENRTNTNGEKFYMVDNLKGAATQFEHYVFNVVLADMHYRSSHIPFSSWETDHDLELENLIKKHFFTECIQLETKASLATTSPAMAPPYNVEYRSEEITDLVVACKDEIFGLAAGSSLNDYIETYSAPVNHNFIISKDRVFLGRLERGMSIPEYLSHHPLAAASLYLHFTQKPATIPSKTQFVIKVTMSDGRQLKYTTAEVEFLDS